MNEELIALFWFGFIRFYSRRFNLSHKEEIELLKNAINENHGKTT